MAMARYIYLFIAQFSSDNWGFCMKQFSAFPGSSPIDSLVHKIL